MRNNRWTGEPQRRRQRTVEERREVVARYVESGQRQLVFARKEGIGVSTLQLWLRQVSASEGRARPEASGQRARPGRTQRLALLEVELEGEGEEGRRGAAGYEVELPCGTRLRLGRDFAESDLRRLLALLREGNS